MGQFHTRYPAVRARFVGQNSVEVAAFVVSGEFEAGLVVLPINDDGLNVSPLLRDEVMWVSASLGRAAAPASIAVVAAARLVLYDAHYGWRDPTRRQLAERAQLAGRSLKASIEVGHVETALRLVARGLGDAFVARAVTQSVILRDGLHVRPFAEPLYDTVALLSRRSAALSPAMRVNARMAREAVTVQFPQEWIDGGMEISPHAL